MRRLLPVMAVFAIACTGIAGAQAVSDPASALTPMQIFIKARQTWKARPLPSYIKYRVVGEFNRKRKHLVAEYEVTYRTNDRDAMTVSVPHSPREKIERTFGSPRISPDATFGVAPRSAYASDTMTTDPAASATSSPAVIGRVTAIVKIPYDISLDVAETYEGHPVYHLLLSPQHDPDIYRLRELWIDKQTFDVWHIRAISIAQVGVIRQPFVYHAYFKPVDSYWMLDRVVASGRLRVFLFQYGGSGDITFPAIEFPANVPAWTFGKKLFEEHEKATKAAN